MKTRQELLDMGVAEYWVNKIIYSQEKENKKEKLIKFVKKALSDNCKYWEEHDSGHCRYTVIEHNGVCVSFGGGYRSIWVADFMVELTKEEYDLLLKEKSNRKARSKEVIFEKINEIVA